MPELNTIPNDSSEKIAQMMSEFQGIRENWEHKSKSFFSRVDF